MEPVSPPHVNCQCPTQTKTEETDATGWQKKIWRDEKSKKKENEYVHHGRWRRGSRSSRSATAGSGTKSSDDTGGDYFDHHGHHHGHYHGHHRGCHDHHCHHHYRQASLIIVITTRRLRGFGRRSWLGKHMVSLAFSTLTPSTSTSLTSTSTLLTSTSTLYYSILSINAKQAKKTFWLHGDSIMFMFLHNVNNDLHSTQITSIVHQHNHCIFITNISIVIMIKCSTGKDCFIIPQANLDRFLPDGVTVSCL